MLCCVRPEFRPIEPATRDEGSAARSERRRDMVKIAPEVEPRLFEELFVFRLECDLRSTQQAGATQKSGVHTHDRCIFGWKA